MAYGISYGAVFVVVGVAVGASFIAASADYVTLGLFCVDAPETVVETDIEAQSGA